MHNVTARDSKQDFESSPGRPEVAARELRRRIISGDFEPGEQLHEMVIAESLGISRNTLRDSFRILAHERLVERKPNRGVFVVVPDMASTIDIYRVRRIIETQAILLAPPRHPAGAAIRSAVESSHDHAARGDWLGVGTANMNFHAAIIALADSPRLDEVFQRISAELRLTFQFLNDPEFLHAPYVEFNQHIADLYTAGRIEEAGKAMNNYLTQSERTLLAAFTRIQSTP